MNRTADIVHRTIIAILSLAVGLVVFHTVWHAFDYYRTPLLERPRSSGYLLYRSAGDVGHGLGIIGSAMILLLLLYSLRKRVRAMQHWGNLRIWLRYHIFLGVAGPVLITLHTAFKVDGLVAVSYWSMIAVAASGVIGRFLYQQIPRNVLGDALTLSEVEERGESMLVALSTEHGMDDRALAGLERVAMGQLEGRPSILALLSLPFVNATLARQLRTWLLGIGMDLGPRGFATARRWVLLSRRMFFFNLVRDLFHWWHVLHKPFAFIMILVMIVHVTVAVALGYTWRL